MPRPDMRFRSPALLALAGATLALAGCGGGGKQAAGNTVEMRDMEVVDGTVNDSMTDLDAVRTDGVGAVNNSGAPVQRPAPKPDEPANGADTETVPSE